MEDSSKYTRREEEEVVVTQKPKFSVRLNGPVNLVEGQSAHYECRIEPYPDPSMKVEWFHNGQPLQIGNENVSSLILQWSISSLYLFFTISCFHFRFQDTDSEQQMILALHL